MTKQEQELKQIIIEKDKQILALTKLYAKEREISLELEEKLAVYKNLLLQYSNILSKVSFKKINELIVATGLIMDTKGDL